jgi:hypothetical protein
MGEALISENAIGTNTATCNSANIANMEGLTNGPTTDQYGGAFGADSDDNDDSGTVQYVSLRYGGKVTGVNVELNGLSLGGIGRNTDIHHIDVMNNVDDGIEIWGGTVNLKYLNVWNIGDDCFDVDQGWRGKAQFLPARPGLQHARGPGLGHGRQHLRDGRRGAVRLPARDHGRGLQLHRIGQPAARAARRSDGSDHATAVARQRPHPVPQLHLHGHRRPPDQLRQRRRRRRRGLRLQRHALVGLDLDHGLQRGPGARQRLLEPLDDLPGPDLGQAGGGLRQRLLQQPEPLGLHRVRTPAASRRRPA